MLVCSVLASLRYDTTTSCGITTISGKKLNGDYSLFSVKFNNSV
ncbi:hypothetical protein IMCC1989_1833 [gamma proteobacterium IMCC1989]|nr:hypothetical protein IMCC1989_1833 [gamma proteobacterium IMCC1989]